MSVQVIQKVRGKDKVIKTIGCATAQHEILNLILIAKQEIERLNAQPKLFVSEKNIAIKEAFASLENASIQTVDPELIFGNIYDHIGFDAIPDKLFRNLVIARLAFPLSKLKTVEYL